METTIDDNGVTVWRWLLDTPAPPFYVPYLPFEGRCDRKQQYEVRYPSNALVTAVFTPAGTGGEERVLPTDIFVMDSYNFLTPIDDRTTRYFWFQMRNVSPDDEHVSREFAASVRAAFTEDKVILEAVQRGLDTATTATVNLRSDAGGVRFRRRHAQLAHADAVDSPSVGWRPCKRAAEEQSSPRSSPTSASQSPSSSGSSSPGRPGCWPRQRTSVADTGNQGLLMFGWQARASARPTSAHPFGYGPERYFWSFVVALVLFSMGGLFALYEGIQKLVHPHEVENAAVAYVILIVAIGLEIVLTANGGQGGQPRPPPGTSWWHVHPHREGAGAAGGAARGRRCRDRPGLRPLRADHGRDHRRPTVGRGRARSRSACCWSSSPSSSPRR